MDQSIYGGTAQFKVKYRTVELQVAPSATASSLGTLKKGAVVTIIAQEDPYYYTVRLDNGLEGYIYKPAGEIVSDISPTPMPRLPGEPEGNGSSNGAVPPVLGGKKPSNSPTYRNGAAPSFSAARASGSGLVITSGEIAVFDKPGIVGKQVAKLKRGDQVMMVGQDSFFYQVALPNGASGYIPRYAAEKA